ncbi:hypothetical protein KR093_006701 [Drosophila rubida]|uniref:Uncharacterized protein n=1 Tax=Drosophila rubida TaxID=30044 RepID=A0AAD4PJH0_9MUSC|nr:hypothetical protein KR093_006701 [Drosophila rubida]
MADSFSSWMSTPSTLANNGEDDEQGSELFTQQRLFGPRLSFFQNELSNLSQLAKLYHNIPVYGNGPLTDDEKREIARRNNGFVNDPADVDNQQEDVQRNANE